METNWRRIIVYILIFLTIVAIVIAIILSLGLGGGGTTPTPTPTPTPSVTATPTGDASTCSGKGSRAISVKCRKDDSSVCPGTEGSNAVQNTMVGQEVCANEDVGKCGFYEACAPTVQEGMACSAAYPGLNQNVRNLSTRTFQQGLFIGCDINNQINNCFCDAGTDGTSILTTASVECFEDTRVNGSYELCGARTFSGGVTQTPTTTPSVTTSPSGSVTATPSACPTPPICNGTLETGAPNPNDPRNCVTYTCNVGGTTTPTPSATIPNTAITGSDEIDRILLAMVLIIGGATIYYFNLHEVAGKYLFNLGGKEILNSIEPIKDRQRKEDKEKFETKLRKKR